MANIKAMIDIDIERIDKIVFVIGLPASGKTTIADRLKDKYPQYHVIHTDDYISDSFVEDIFTVMQEVLNNTDKKLIVEGVQAYRLLRKGLEEDCLYPDLVINVMAESNVRIARALKRGTSVNLTAMDSMLIRVLNAYMQMYNPYTPRYIEYLNS